MTNVNATPQTKEYWDLKDSLAAELKELQVDYDKDLSRYNELKSKDLNDREDFYEFKDIERRLDDKREFIEIKQKQFAKNVNKKAFEIMEGSKYLYDEAKADIKVLQDKLKEQKLEMESTNQQIIERFQKYRDEHHQGYDLLRSQLRGEVPSNYEWVKFLKTGNDTALSRIHSGKSFRPYLTNGER